MNKYESIIIVNPNTDEAGLKALEEKFTGLINENGKVESCTEYYANGEKSNSTSYFESGNIKSCSEYDESGKEIKTIIYYENGNEKTRSEYSYHENGEVKKSDLYKDGILSQSRECDEEGNLITYTRVGIETNTGDITYDIYDANDNLIKIEY